MERVYIAVLLLNFVFTAVLTWIAVPVLKKIKYGQHIRQEGPKSHLNKSGTPTMGGAVFLIVILITYFVFGNNMKGSAFYLLIAVLFGFTGMVDDLLKIAFKRNLGLDTKQKLVMQAILSAILVFYQMNFTAVNTTVFIPFMDTQVNAGIFYIPLTLIAVTGTVNSVNLTDGLDGLASGVTAVCLSCFFVVLAILGNYRFESILCIAGAGICFGFILFNKYPAKIFMGDTGSLFLGGLVSVIAVATGTVLYIPLLGGIYFAESLSVIIQVGSYRIRKKRVFRMSPLHHHFEEVGWHERKVVKYFYLWTVILGVTAIIASL